MDAWEHSFRSKSSARHRRRKRARLLWRASLIALVSVLILVILWTADRLTTHFL